MLGTSDNENLKFCDGVYILLSFLMRSGLHFGDVLKPSSVSEQYECLSHFLQINFVSGIGVLFANLIKNNIETPREGVVEDSNSTR